MKLCYFTKLNPTIFEYPIEMHLPHKLMKAAKNTVVELSKRYVIRDGKHVSFKSQNSQK